jgi:hypothetical protein
LALCSNTSTADGPIGCFFVWFLTAKRPGMEGPTSGWLRYRQYRLYLGGSLNHSSPAITRQGPAAPRRRSVPPPEFKARVSQAVQPTLLHHSLKVLTCFSASLTLTENIRHTPDRLRRNIGNLSSNTYFCSCNDGGVSISTAHISVSHKQSSGFKLERSWWPQSANYQSCTEDLF